jgi:hypothetical protein
MSGVPEHRCARFVLPHAKPAWTGFSSSLTGEVQEHEVDKAGIGDRVLDARRQQDEIVLGVSITSGDTAWTRTSASARDLAYRKKVLWL